MKYEQQFQKSTWHNRILKFLPQSKLQKVKILFVVNIQLFEGLLQPLSLGVQVHLRACPVGI